MITAAATLVPNSLDAILVSLVRLPSNAMDALISAVRSPSAFDADRERCESLASILGMQPENVGVLLNILGILYDRVAEIARTPGDFAETIESIVQEFIPEDEDSDKESLRRRLGELLKENPNVKSAKKLRRLRSGFIKNAVAFSSLADLRPNFSDGFQEIQGFIPILQLRITTDATNPSEKFFVFQLDSQSLTSLKKAVEDAETKLATLTTTARSMMGEDDPS